MFVEVKEFELLKLIESGSRVRIGKSDSREREFHKQSENDYLITDDGGGFLLSKEFMEDNGPLYFY